MWSHVGHKVGSRTGVTSCSIFCLLICFVWTFSQAFDESSDAENQRPVKPAMEGHLQIGTKLWHYLGGFCFGHKSPYEQSHAGSINLQLRYDGEPEGMVMFCFTTMSQANGRQSRRSGIPATVTLSLMPLPRLTVFKLERGKIIPSSLISMLHHAIGT